MPKSLQQRAIDIAHETHPGLTKTKALIREKIWFPNIDKIVKNTVDRCIACQAVSRTSPPEPLTVPEMPKGRWDTIHVDFYGPLPTGEYILVAIDRYSRYSEVEVVRSTKASTVIPRLDQIFARHGIPTTIKSDNGHLSTALSINATLKFSVSKLYIQPLNGHRGTQKQKGLCNLLEKR